MDALDGTGKSDDSEHQPTATEKEVDEAPLGSATEIATVVVEANNESEIGEGSATSEKKSNFESDKKMLDTKDPAKEKDPDISRDELLNFVESIEREDEENNWLALDDNVDDEGNEIPTDAAPAESNVDPMQPPKSLETDSVEQSHLPEDPSQIHEGVDKATTIPQAEENTEKSTDSNVLDGGPEDEQMDTSDDLLTFLPNAVLKDLFAEPAVTEGLINEDTAEGKLYNSLLGSLINSLLSLMKTLKYHAQRAATRPTI